jgi:hypothetical protein
MGDFFSVLGRVTRRAFFPQKPAVTNVYITQPPEEEGTANLLPLVVLGGLGVLLLTQKPRRRRKRR